MVGIGQPSIMGQITGDILLGPSVFRARIVRCAIGAILNERRSRRHLDGNCRSVMRIHWTLAARTTAARALDRRRQTMDVKVVI
jgi:hypothetical protein